MQKNEVFKTSMFTKRQYLQKCAVEKTKLEAQTLVNTTISGSVDEEGNQIVINLP